MISPQSRLLFRSHLDRRLDWASWANSPKPLQEAHHAMEINFVERGQVTYLFGGNILSLSKGCLALFWGIVPHRIVSFEDDTLHHWLEIPLALFVQWRMAAALVAQLMAGGCVTEQTAENQQHDCAAFYRWHRDLESSSSEAQQIVALEVEARLRRMALSFSRDRKSRVPQEMSAGKDMDGLRKVGRMAAFVAEHYTEPLRLEAIAREAHLRPDYATTLFKKVSGVNIMDYVTQHRISHSKRLLLTTNDKVLDIALQSGFGSSSRFYEAFAQWCDQTPQQYRKLEQKGLEL